VVYNETEAYTEEDKACHAYNGKITQRNKVMFEEAGTIYIYFIYGMYYCLNIVTEKKGRGCAVLLRGIIPTININQIKKNRKYIDDKNLTNGPGKLVMALNIPKDLNGVKLDKNCKLQIKETNIIIPNIKETPRIGIKENKDVLWRFISTDLKKTFKKKKMRV